MASDTSAPRLTPYSIIDSRGRPTLRVRATLRASEGEGDVPAGASKGSDEARVVSQAQAERNIVDILQPLVTRLWPSEGSVSAANLMALDTAMTAAGGINFAKLGANATLPVSRALWQLGASLNAMSLHAFLRQACPAKGQGVRTRFMMNIFNGGLHAIRAGEVLGQHRIAIQEIMVVPSPVFSYAEQRAAGEEIDFALGQILTATYGAEAVSRADEAGFSVRGLGDGHVAIAHVAEAVRNAGYHLGETIFLALDVAASSFYDAERGHYMLGTGAHDTQEMVRFLIDLLDRYPGQIISIEDGLDENDWDGWHLLTQACRQRKVLTVGDDLFVTQRGRLTRGIERQSADAILIKPNQNGTIGGTLEVIKQAYDAGMAAIISHRSGETLDDSIADLAAATAAWGLKSGDPQALRDFPNPASHVRRVKYLRMEAIEETDRFRA